MPILNEEFQQLYNSIDTAKIEEEFRENKNLHTIMFEMWGDSNIHTISYNASRDLNLSLLCGYNSEYELLSLKDLKNIESMKPEEMLKLKGNTGEFKEDKFENGRKSGKIRTYNGKIEEILEKIREYLEKLNQSQEENQIEGIILNTKIKDKNVLMKLKPPSITEAISKSNNIPQHVIKKEVLKFFEEYGKNKAIKLIETDINIATDFISENLLEEYPEKLIYKIQSKNKIEKQLKETSESKKNR